MFLKIADISFKVNPLDESVEELCKEYTCDEGSSFDAELVIDKVAVGTEYKRMKNANLTGATLEVCQFSALSRKVCAEALNHSAFLMHGVLIEYEGKGYLFSAKSGTGKTTHVYQWQKLFGEDKVTIINGDKPIIRMIDGKFYGYGTPWCGKEGYNKNARVELVGVCFVERAEENSIRRIYDEEAIPMIFSQIMVCDSADLGRQLELVDNLISHVPTYVLGCNISEEAAKVAYEGMNK